MKKPMDKFEEEACKLNSYSNQQSFLLKTMEYISMGKTLRNSKKKYEREEATFAKFESLI